MKKDITTQDIAKILEIEVTDTKNSNA